MLKRAANPPTIKQQFEVITVITLENAKCCCGSTQSSCRLRHGFMSQAEDKNLVLQSRITQLKASTSCIQMPMGIHLVRERACWTAQRNRSQAEVPCYPLPEILDSHWDHDGIERCQGTFSSSGWFTGRGSGIASILKPKHPSQPILNVDVLLVVLNLSCSREAGSSKPAGISESQGI